MAVGGRDHPHGLHHPLGFDGGLPVVLGEDVLLGLSRRPGQVVAGLNVHLQLRSIRFLAIRRARLRHGPELGLLAAGTGIDGEGVAARRADAGVARVGHHAPRPELCPDGQQHAAGDRDLIDLQLVKLGDVPADQRRIHDGIRCCGCGGFGHAESGDKALCKRAPGLGVGELGEAFDGAGEDVFVSGILLRHSCTLRYGGRRDRPVRASSAATCGVSQTEVARVERPCTSSSRVPSFTRRCQRRQRHL